MLPSHKLGVRVLTSFTRFDDFLGDGGLRNIGSLFSADSVTGAQINQLNFTQSAIRTLTGNPALKISAGNLVTTANSRIMTAPIILEYGVTSRLTLGVAIPLVETRTTLNSQLNPTLGVANVGPNPQAAASWQTDSTLVASLRNAATNLGAALQGCQATPSANGCSQLLAQQGAVQSLINSTTPIADALAALYGVGSSSPGTTFIPIQGSTTQNAVNTGVEIIRGQYATFAQTGAAGITVVDPHSPVGAAAQAANHTLQAILKEAGYDSLQSTDRSSIGDITIGATYQIANSFGDSSRLANGSPAYRLAVNVGGRIGTGEPASRNRLFDNATGYGQPGLILGAATDIRLARRYMLSALGSYTHQIGTIEVPRVPNAQNAQLPLVIAAPATYSAGDVATFTVVPRFRLGGLFSIDGAYTFTHAAADVYSGLAAVDLTALSLAGAPVPPFGLASATSHQVGFGFTYSTIFNDRGPGRIPVETSFRHTELIAASGGPVNKTFVDQIQLRVFFR